MQEVIDFDMCCGQPTRYDTINKMVTMRSTGWRSTFQPNALVHTSLRLNIQIQGQISPKYKNTQKIIWFENINISL